jgi:hypothetical protein
MTDNLIKETEMIDIAETGVSNADYSSSLQPGNAEEKKVDTEDIRV